MFRLTHQIRPEAYRLLDAGISALRSFDWHEALKFFDQTLTLEPKFASALANRAKVHMALGQHGKAIKDLSSAIKLKPTHADYYFFRAEALTKIEQYARAADDFGRAFKLNPSDTENLRRRGETYTRSNDLGRALRDLNTVINLDEYDHLALRSRGLLYREFGDDSKALKDYDAAIAAYGRDATTYLCRGSLFESLGKLPLALENYQKALHCEPERSEAALAIENIERAIATQRPDASGDDNDTAALIARLRARGKEAVRQRDEWERRALAAERQVAELEAERAMQRSSPGDSRFDELRRFLAREFHPDHVKADGIEKILRAEIFKKVWPKVEEIGKPR